MTFDNFFSLLVSVYSILLNLMQRISAIHNLFSSVLRDAETRGVLPGSDSVSVIGFGDPPPSQNWQTPSLQGFQKPRATSLEIDEEDELGSVPIPTSKPLPAAPGNNSKERRKSATNGSAYGQLISESSEICFSAADFAHVRCAKLVGVRADQNAQLNPKDFYRLFASTWEFVVEGEEMCGQMCFGLRGTMLSQAKSFLNHFHMERMKQLSLLIENEQWMQAEVPVDFQLIVDRICASAKAGSLSILCDENQNSSPTSSSPDGLNNIPTTIDARNPGPFSRTASFSSTAHHQPIQHSNSFSSITSTMSRESGNSTKQLHVNQYSKDSQKVLTQQGYHAVGCSLMLVKMLEEYLICVAKVQAITTDAVGRLVEILRIFNSKTCQSVLGAGAMRSAGLKNITAKHIALAAQTLGLMMALIPHVRECMNANMTAKQAIMLTEFDRMLRDFVEHQNELYLKLVSIMDDRLAIHCRSMQATNWDVPDPKQPPGAPSSWMELLVKESATLHKVLGKYLPVEALKLVMGNVFKSYAKRLEEEVQKVDVYTGAGKNRLLFDIQYYVRKLNDLEHIEGPGNNLEVAVNNLKIKEKSGRLSGLGGTRRPSSEETRGMMRTTPPQIVSTPGDHSSRVSMSSLAPQQPSKQPTISPAVSMHETATTGIHHTQNSNPTSVAPPPTALSSIPPVSAIPPAKPSAAGWSQRMVNMMNSKTKPATTTLPGSHDNLAETSSSSLISSSTPPRGSIEIQSVPGRRSLENPSATAPSSGNGKPAPVSAPQLQTTPSKSSDPLSSETGTAAGVAGFLSGATSGLTGRSGLSNETARKKLTEASSYLGKMFHRKDTAFSTPAPAPPVHPPTRSENSVNQSVHQDTVASVLQPSALPLKPPSALINDISHPNIPLPLPSRPSLETASYPQVPVVQTPTEPLLVENGASGIALPETFSTELTEPVRSLETSRIADDEKTENFDGNVVLGTETAKSERETAFENEESAIGSKRKDENDSRKETFGTDREESTEPVRSLETSRITDGAEEENTRKSPSSEPNFQKTGKPIDCDGNVVLGTEEEKSKTETAAAIEELMIGSERKDENDSGKETAIAMPEPSSTDPEELTGSVPPLETSRITDGGGEENTRESQSLESTFHPAEKTGRPIDYDGNVVLGIETAKSETETASANEEPIINSERKDENDSGKETVSDVNEHIQGPVHHAHSPTETDLSGKIEVEEGLGSPIETFRDFVPVASKPEKVSAVEPIGSNPRVPEHIDAGFHIPFSKESEDENEIGRVRVPNDSETRSDAIDVLVEPMDAQPRENESGSMRPRSEVGDHAGVDLDSVGVLEQPTNEIDRNLKEKVRASETPEDPQNESAGI